MIRIALVDDHALVRQLLKQLIEVTLGWTVIIEATNGKDCLNQLAHALIAPDVVLMDVAMPIMDGTEATSIIHTRYPRIKVIGLSSLAHAHVVVDMIRKGAMGFLTKSTSPQTLVQAVQSVMNDTPYIEDCLFEEVANDIGMADPKPLLSDKQKQFLKLCATDSSYKEIANLLHISPNTVDSYRADLFRKLNVRTRQGLVVYAFRTGILST